MALKALLSQRGFITACGLVMGLATAVLSRMGNPFNGGIAPTCFIRDTAGALGLHDGAAFQYLRPELAGFVLGSFLTSLAFKEFRPRGGSAPLIRFVLAMLLMVGSLTFLGCPTRVIVRLAGGDLNALAGLAGLLAGILAGVWFIRRGFDLGRNRPLPALAGFLAPAAAVGVLSLIFLAPPFVHESKTGWGAEHAAVGISLFAGLLIGGLAQRTRLCFMGAWRDVFLIRDSQLLTGVAAFFAGTLAGNLFFGQFHPGFAGQPMAHSSHLWNFLGMTLVGLAAAFLGACPLRQMILSGQGDNDAALTVLGMLTGAALVHNFGISSCGGKLAQYGPVAVIAALAACLVIGLLMRPLSDQS